MKTLETGPDTIKKICSALRDDTLEPAQKEAREIVAQAKQQAEEIIAEANKNADLLHLQAKALAQQEYAVFQSSLEQASKQALEMLRQSIENKLFNENLSRVIEKGAAEPNLIANLISTIVKALENEGLGTNLTALVSKNIDASQVNKLLLQGVLENLNNRSVAIGDFNAGVQLKVNNKNMKIDISEDALKELLGNHIVRKDFRKIVFDTRI